MANEPAIGRAALGGPNGAEELVHLDFNERGIYFSELAAAEVERTVIMKFLMCHRRN
jgi:hypothetical protein